MQDGFLRDNELLVQELERLVRTSLFKSANELMGLLVQGADESGYEKAEVPLRQTGASRVSARQI